MVEQRTENPCVPGSIPGDTTKILNRSGSVEDFLLNQTMSELLSYISVILPLKLEWTPCYSIKQSEVNTNEGISVGTRVKVRFASKEYTGVVSAIDVTPDIDSSRILPIVSTEHTLEKILPSEIELWKQVSDYYMCSIGEVYKAAYPTGKIHLEEARAVSLNRMQDRRMRLISSISDKLDRLNIKLTAKTEQSEKHRAGTKIHAKLLSDIAATREEIARTQNALENARKAAEGHPISGLKDLKDLICPSLTPVQKKAFDEIRNGFFSKKPVLLHGATGSGKTEIYIKAAMEALERGTNVLYLVPEIALSRQLEERLYEHFGARLLTFHSGESTASRRNTAEAIRSAKENGQAYIVLGTRSALFLPHNRLGLIIVDEEHDSSYKQDSPAPRYNGRDTALMLARIHGADVLLGSATPSLESLYNCRNGKHTLVELHERYHGAANSEVEIIDTKAERKKRGMCGSISRKLADHIRKTIENGHQVMILRSRRSWAPALQCEDCGEIHRCPHCNVGMSLHKDGTCHEIVRCHYCGHTEAYTGKCLRCGGNLLSMGAGTQKIEEEIRSLFPDARIARLDSDTSQNRNYLTKTIKAFSKGELDILIGTQMVAKGFDFSNLMLVAIIAADAMLGIQDFRADEKAHQLLEQFRGRCGRRESKGLFVIQTAQPEHPVYRNISDCNLSGSDFLMTERKDFNFPPYTRIIEICVKDIYEDRADRMAGKLNISLESALKTADNLPMITGPYAPMVDKVADNFIRTIRISLRKDRQLTMHKKRIAEAIRNFEKSLKYDGHISVNVDPS